MAKRKSDDAFIGAILTLAVMVVVGVVTFLWHLLAALYRWWRSLPKHDRKPREYYQTPREEITARSRQPQEPSRHPRPTPLGSNQNQITPYPSRAPRKQPPKRAEPEAIAEWRQNSQLLWEGNRTVTFSYSSKRRGGERTRRTVDVTGIFISAEGNIYLEGKCHLRQETRDFNIERIVSKIKEGKTYHDLPDWIESVAGVITY